MTGMERGKLLIVEDDDFMRQCVKESVERRLDVDVFEAGSYQHALEQIKAHEPDAVLTDIILPDQNGLALLKTVREMGLDTPFLVLTGYMSPDHLKSALRLGAFDFLEKPCDTDRIVKKIKATVEFGLILKQLHVEVEHLCAKSNLKGEELDRLKEVQKKLLLLGRVGVDRALSDEDEDRDD